MSPQVGTSKLHCTTFYIWLIWYLYVNIHTFIFGHSLSCIQVCGESAASYLILQKWHQGTGSECWRLCGINLHKPLSCLWSHRIIVPYWREIQKRINSVLWLTSYSDAMLYTWGIWTWKLAQILLTASKKCSHLELDKIGATNRGMDRNNIWNRYSGNYVVFPETPEKCGFLDVYVKPLRSGFS